MEFFEWFETCPTWQAIGVGAALFSIIMGVTGLLLRLSTRNRQARTLRAFVDMRGPLAES